MMKKIVFLFLFIFCFFFKFTVLAQTYRIVWDESTTYIDVPLGANINQYKDIPKAYLYINNELKNDAEMSYLTSGDWLYLLSDVNTSIVGEYKVWYKASELKYSPGQCEGYKTLVTFNVIDNIEPIIVSIPTEMTYLIGADKPSYLNFILANDNSGVCNIVIDDSNVIYDVVGIYPLYVSVDDGYNVIKRSFNINVKDPIGPVVSFIGENNLIKINKGDKVDLKSYFKAIDNTDGDVLNSISYPKFNTDIEDEFSLEVSFSDSNGNKTSIVVDVKIVDINEPYINLYSDSLILEFKTDYLKELKNNIKEAYLGNQSIKDDVIIDISYFKEEVGVYNVYYTYTYKDQVITKSIKVNVLSSKAPVLIVENFDCNIGEKPDYLEYIQVIDDSDPLINTKIEINDSAVDYYTTGRYNVTVSVVNSSGLSKTETLYINIINEKGNAFLSIDGDFNNKKILIIGLGIVFVAVIGFFWYNKKRKKQLN